MCLWDEKGANKVHAALHEDILDFIKQAQAVSIFCGGSDSFSPSKEIVFSGPVWFRQKENHKKRKTSKSKQTYFVYHSKSVGASHSNEHLSSFMGGRSAQTGLEVSVVFSASVDARGGLFTAEGVHRGMAQVLHAVRLPAEAVRAARDCAGRQGAQHHAEEDAGRGEHRQKGSCVEEQRCMVDVSQISI